MAEKFRFFDAVEDENGLYDREYNAQEFTDYFKALVTTGVMKGALNQLKVSANGSSMITSIDSGIAFILGRYYENDSPLELTHDTEVLSKSRIDRIVIRMDLSTEARYVKAFIKKGVASASPVAPSLTQTTDVYEISLAQVKIVGGQTYIGVNDITDERGQDVICPWAGSRILPNFDNNFVLTELENKANKQLEEPIQVILATGWEHGSGNASPLVYYKDGFGIVHLEGTIRVPNDATANSVFTTMPEGYRPLRRENHIISVYAGSSAIGALGIYEDGRLQSPNSASGVSLTINARWRAE